MQQTDEIMNFEQFRAAVGASQHVVRTALRVLKKEPVKRFDDLRFNGYKPEWVKEVQDWIRDNLVNPQ